MRSSHPLAHLPLVLSLLLLNGCGSDPAPTLDGTSPDGSIGSDTSGTPDSPATVDTGFPADLAAFEASAPPDGTVQADAPTPLSRGLAWVRSNPMFISGLTVTMGAPAAAAVDDYFNAFNATAVHLWEKGLPTAMDGWRLHGPPDTRFVSWVHKDGTSLDNGQIIGGYPANVPGRIGYQIGDEPMDMVELQEMEVGINAVRQVDPDALIYVNFSYSATGLQQMFTYYGEQMDADVVSYDNYSRSNKAYGRMALFRTTALKYGRPYWRYMRSYYDVGDSDSLTESDMRWDAFSGLLNGFTGHTWFIYQIGNNAQLMPSLFTAADSFAAAKTALYAVAAQINEEMANLGRCITQLTSTDVRYIPSIGLLQPAGTVTWQPGAGGDPYLTQIAPAPGQLLLDILVGFFADDAGEIYVMVQNVRHENGDWPIDNNNQGTIRLTFDFASAGSNVSKTTLQSLNKLTGQLEALTLNPAGGSAYYYDAVLAAGDAVLFKYDTGSPFALQP